jgi:hypothetical protein
MWIKCVYSPPLLIGEGQGGDNARQGILVHATPPSQPSPIKGEGVNVHSFISALCVSITKGKTFLIVHVFSPYVEVVKSKGRIVCAQFSILFPPLLTGEGQGGDNARQGILAYATPPSQPSPIKGEGVNVHSFISALGVSITKDKTFLICSCAFSLCSG